MTKPQSSFPRAVLTLLFVGLILAVWLPIPAVADSMPEITEEPIITQTEEYATPTEVVITEQPTEAVPTIEVVEPTIEVVIPTEEIATTAPTETSIPATLTTEAPTVTPISPTATNTSITAMPSHTATIALPTNTKVPPTSTTPPPTPTSTRTPRNTRLMQTFCQMNIDDAGDENAFTFQFSAVNAHNIESYAWDFGDGGSATTATASHTYTTTGTFAITLTCTPKAGFGSPMTLIGSITVASNTIADFTLTPATVFTGLPPFTITAINKSKGSALKYNWKVSTSADVNNVAATIYTSTAKDITYKFTSTEIISYPATFYFHLSVTDGAGVSGYMMRSVVFNAPPPKATFKLSPTSGSTPLLVTVSGVDLLEGPLTNWEWDFNADNVVDATGAGPHTYTYVNPGVYPIKLNYSGPGGGGTVTKSVGVYPPSDPVKSLFTYELMGRDGTGIRVCFTNNSTGPVAVSKWDFDDNGTIDLTSSDKIVCNTYAAEGNVNVKLRVENANASTTSTSSQSVNVVAEPVASFTINPGTEITWGTKINLTDTSTGIITQWEWDFNGDGTVDSTNQHITNLSLTQLGANPIRLTVTGPGGKSYVEVIVSVKRLELTCAFTGTLNVLPGAGGQTYNSNVGNQGGRTITYQWTITGNGSGLPKTFNTQNITVDWGTIGYGSYQVTLEAFTEDGSSCSESKTVTRSWAALDCKMSTTLPTTVYADGKVYTFTANVGNVNGRSLIAYEWYVDGVLQYSGPSNSFNYTTSINTAGLPLNVTISYHVYFDNGAGYTPSTSNCSEAKPFTISQWPPLECTGIAGQGAPLPGTPDNTTRNHTYTANVNGIAGRTVSYFWTVSDGTITTPNPRTGNNQATVIWNGTAASLPTAPNNDNISVAVTVTNPDGTTVSCNTNRAVSVMINKLVCNVPNGDNTPVVNETVNYTTNIVNPYGRPTTALLWEFEQLTPVTNASTSTNNSFNFTFPNADATYRVRYSISLGAAGGLPGDSCQSAWKTITVYGTGLNFECESGLSGNTTPTNPAGTYVYTIDMDNGNLIELEYVWTLIDYTGKTYALGSVLSAVDGIISSPAFTLAQLSPLFADNYTLRVDVKAKDTAMSSHTCSKSLLLNVGTLNVNYTYTAATWTNTAVPVNQPICLTNTSTSAPGSINDLNYTWTVDGAPTDNSWGSSTTTEQQPATCISFSKPGAYTINLNGVTDSGNRSGNKSMTFTVYGLQSILINRSGTNFAPSTQSFTATGTNITGGYNWEFRRVADNLLLGTRTGATVTYPFAAQGQYRAIVTGTGPLGATSASLDFNLLSAGGLSAAFVASQYGGIAPMNVCFTDKSVSGSPILKWEWDFNGDGTFDLIYDQSNIPANICHLYDVPSRAYLASLRVTNASFVDTATNTIRTYNELESSATFSVEPKGGGYFCFDGIITPDVEITGWDFGDNTTGPGNDPICHTYGASGTYIVTMKIKSGTTTGEVVRVVVVDLGGGTPPSLTGNGSCSADVKATFTITNKGGAMKTPDQVYIRDADGNVILIAPLQLGAGASTSFTVSGYVGEVILTTTDIVLKTTTDCVQPPILTGVSTCLADGSAVFTISNTSTESASNQPYEIRNASNTLVTSGTLTVLAGGSMDITVSNVWGKLTLTSSGIQGATTVLDVSSNCATPPLLKIAHSCQIDGTAVFTITNTSPDTAASQPYEIRDASNALIDSGTLSVGMNSSTDITVKNVYGALTFTSTGVQGKTTQISTTSNCAEPPLLSGSVDCALDGTATFTIDNKSKDTAANQPYEVTDENGDTIASGVLTIPAGGSMTVTINGVYTALMLTSEGVQGATTVLSIETNCDEPPTLSVTSTCQIDGTAVFTVTNTSTESAANQPYEIRDASNALIDSGTLAVGMNDSTDITVSNVYGLLTFSSVGVEGKTTQISTTSDCNEPPILSGSVDCALDGTATFTIDNKSKDTAANQPYEVTDENGNIIASDVLTIPAGGSMTVTINGVYTALMLTSEGVEGATTVLGVETNCDEPPVLSITSTCQIDGTAVFTVTNSSTESAASQPYEIRNGNNVLIDSGTLMVNPNNSTDISVSNVYGVLTFSSVGAEGKTTEISTTSDCNEPPVLSVISTCQIDGTAVFTVTNSSTESAASQPYEIRNGNNVLIDSGTLTVNPNNSTDISVSNVYGVLTFSSVGVEGKTTQISTTSDCNEPPVLSVISTCQIDGTAVFTVTNSSTESAASQPYEIRDASNALIDSGTLNVGTNSSTEITVSNIYGALTFSSVGVEGKTTQISTTSDCNEPPMLTGSAECALDGRATFTINNLSKDTAANQPYEVTDENGAIIDSGTLNIAAGEVATVTINDVYSALTLTSTGSQGATTVLNITTDCTQPPVLSVTSACQIDGTAVFTVTNTSTESAANQPYEIREENNELVTSGTLTVNPNSSTEITVEKVYGQLTFTSTGTQGVITATSDCAQPLRLTGDAVCESGTAVFTIENRSSTAANQRYTITSSDGSVIESGTLEIDGKGSQTVSVKNMSGQTLTFNTDGLTSLILTTSCAVSSTDTVPAISGSSMCLSDGESAFTLKNEGEAAINQAYQITDEAGELISSGTLNLNSGESMTLNVNQSFVSLTTSGMISLTMNSQCNAIAGGIDITDGNGDTTSHLPRLDLTPGMPDATIVPRPDWEGITVGGAVCTEWLIYHTNMTGDWEIFRLGDGGEARLAQADPNLSQGRGQDVTDMAPTRSPDGEWIAFTSNRVDGDNWELYLASVDNTVIRRMTYNTFARDIDPAWSPDGRFVAFETDRDGNWELYLFDLATGAEVRLTDDRSSDINPFWSPDSGQIAFQSDRSGKWQIYLLDLTNGEVTLISDGKTEDHDPAISFDGKQIAFRAYELGSGMSGIYTMQIDGSEKTLISNGAGSASNHTWSRDDELIAYQSNLDGDLDVYVYELQTEKTRLVTDNTIPDYAPTWLCDARTVVFTSDVMVDANIFNTPAVPMEAEPILVDKEASQMTFDKHQDVYPENTPSEENASREGNVPPMIGSAEIALEG
jgi:Tol biopolymer transport system component/PKD repeat protein